MKEIGKLIELLNEYENRDDDQQIEWRIGEGDKGENEKVRGIVNNVYMGWVSELVVCSVHYGFIKRLFDKDKIDWSKFHKYSFYKKDNKFIQYYDYESLLMALSISDTPIEDLISYLK